MIAVVQVFIIAFFFTTWRSIPGHPMCVQTNSYK